MNALHSAIETDGASLLVGDQSVAVPVGSMESVLVGREPDPTRLPAGVAPANWPIRTWPIRVPSVSLNHLLIWREGEQLAVRDLASKNGSWLRLPADGPVAVSGPCVVRFGSARSALGADDQPADASWTDTSDFGRAVAIAVNEWLDRRKLPARAAIESRNVHPDEPSAVPLSDGRILRVLVTETVDSSGPALLENVWRYVERQKAAARVEDETRGEGMILASPAIRKVHTRVVEAARRGLRLLLMGPSGSGKEGLARCYHRHSPGHGPFVARNCSQLRGELLRSELFGAEAGAFTGCVHRIVGAVERAHGGTLFLDEIGDMSEDVQPMLLRFLDDGAYERMGAYGQSRTANVGIVCATNKDLRAATQRREFRADLWYRLSIEVVEVPPLRDRLPDVIVYLKTTTLPGGTPVWSVLDEGARALVSTYPWDGNFRELANFVARIPQTARPGTLDRDSCGELLSRGALQPYSSVRGAALPGAADGSWGGVVDRAIRAFTDDYGSPPKRWDDVKDYVEKYLKPLLFAHLSGATSLTSFADAQPQALASLLDADRGTALKQLSRYFERFAH
jgi:DNA-binding NtrC family response regulator